MYLMTAGVCHVHDRAHLVLRVTRGSPPDAAFALAAFAAGALLPLRGPPFFGGGRLPAIVSGFVCSSGEPASP